MSEQDTQRQLDDLRRTLIEVQKSLSKEQEDMEPLLNLFNAGKMLGKVLFYSGGVISGIAATYAAMKLWFTGHVL